MKGIKPNIMVQTVKTVREQINDALCGKIVYWLGDNNQTQFGIIVRMVDDYLICTQKGLPEKMRRKGLKDNAVVAVDLDRAMLGVYEHAEIYN